MREYCEDFGEDRYQEVEVVGALGAEGAGDDDGLRRRAQHRAHVYEAHAGDGALDRYRHRGLSPSAR